MLVVPSASQYILDAILRPCVTFQILHHSLGQPDFDSNVSYTITLPKVTLLLIEYSATMFTWRPTHKA